MASEIELLHIELSSSGLPVVPFANFNGEIVFEVILEESFAQYSRPAKSHRQDCEFTKHPLFIHPPKG